MQFSGPTYLTNTRNVQSLVSIGFETNYIFAKLVLRAQALARNEDSEPGQNVFLAKARGPKINVLTLPTRFEKVVTKNGSENVFRF